jgi:NAD(P)-dependent dehydrogenase (short-subunit alcohol dehydrogenase family)
MKFKDNTVIITGAGRGLGKRLAERFGEEGANVVVASRTKEDIKKVAENINTGKGKAIPVSVDVSCEEEVKKLVKRTVLSFGRIDILINNAAIHRTIPILKTDVDIWRKIIDVNLTGSFLCAREAALIMKRQNGGKIINISSTASKLFFPGFGAYSASKAGVIGFSNVLAEELKSYNINVVTVNLGLVNTEYSRSRIKNDEPQNWLQPDEVAEVIMFLCSPQANIITGTTIDVFGRRK